MTTIKQIMSLVDAYGDERCSGNEYNNRSAEKQARDAVLKALQGYAPPRQPEPVIDKSAAIRIATALGWTPPQQEQKPVAWVDLSTIAILDIYQEVLKEWRGGHQVNGQIAFARALEAKIKEVNT